MEGHLKLAIKFFLKTRKIGIFMNCVPSKQILNEETSIAMHVVVLGETMHFYLAASRHA